jgi:hypothetical protein
MHEHQTVIGRIVLVVLAVTLVGVGCGGSDESSETGPAPPGPTEDLGDFFTRRIDHEFKGQFGRSWDELHPGQQALVSRTRYEECRQETTNEALSDVQLESLSVIEVYDDPLDLIGVPEKISKAVTVEITLTDGEKDETITDTFHAILIDGQWVWVLPAADIRAFLSGNCPT